MKTACKKYEERLLALLLNEVESGEREALEAHVAGCAGCAEELEELKRTVGRLEREFRAQRDEPRLSAQRVEELRAGNVRTIGANGEPAGGAEAKRSPRLLQWGALAAVGLFGLIATIYVTGEGDREIARAGRVRGQGHREVAQADILRRELITGGPEAAEIAGGGQYRSNDSADSDSGQKQKDDLRAVGMLEMEVKNEADGMAEPAPSEIRGVTPSRRPETEEPGMRGDAPAVAKSSAIDEVFAVMEQDAARSAEVAASPPPMGTPPPVSTLADASSRQMRSYAGAEEARMIAPVPRPPVPAPPNDAAFDSMYFQNYGVNPFFDTAEDPQSTFAIDVDTASFTIVRNYLNRGALPPPEAVRVEEFVNYLPADYPAPASQTFAVYSEVAPSPFDEGYSLLRIGIKGREIAPAERKPVVLTFVVDVSGSMAREDRLGLVKRTLQMLMQELRPGDRVGLAVYGSRGAEILSHHDVTDEGAIESGIAQLQPGGSTNAEEGLRIGYAMARRAFDPRAVNRVILCTDGVANAGQTGAESILDVIGRESEDRIYLTALGFGLGNYNDVLLEQLADRGNGHYAYLDSDSEARDFIRRRLAGSMEVIAQDVKIQVEFDPEVVSKYRLLGYENRDVADRDFRNDARDAGEIGAGHATTALYEIRFAVAGERRALGVVRLRFKDPEEDLAVREIEGELGREPSRRSFEEAGAHFKRVWIAAQFAEILRESVWARNVTLERLLAMAEAAAETEGTDLPADELRRMMVQALRLRGPSDPRPLPLEEMDTDVDAEAAAGRPSREDAVPMREAR